jgi:hypothetical protein
MLCMLYVLDNQVVTSFSKENTVSGFDVACSQRAAKRRTANNRAAIENETMTLNCRENRRHTKLHRVLNVSDLRLSLG